MRRLDSLLVLGTWPLLAFSGLAQQSVTDSNVVIRSSVREVLLEVVVRDAHGRLVTKIDPAQIAVYEDGVRQQITSFHLVQGKEVRAEDAQQAAQTATAGPRNHARPPFNPLRTVNLVCLVLNDLNADTRGFAFDAARKFVNSELRPDTYIGVFSLDSSGLRPVFPFSNNRERLLKAVELAAVNQLPTLGLSTAAMLNGMSMTASGLPTGAYTSGSGSTADPLGTWGDIGMAEVGGMREIDALLGLVRQLSPLPFQKTVLLLGTGLTRPPNQLEYWNSLIAQANRGGITFYGVDVYGLGVCQDSDALDCGAPTTPSGGSRALVNQAATLSQQQGTVGRIPRAQAGSTKGLPGQAAMEASRQMDYLGFGVSSANTQEALRELAESTGGFLIANTNNTDALLARVMEDLDTHYEVSYRPVPETYDGHFRKIEVKLTRPDLRVQTRSGYFAVPDNGNPLTPEEIAGLQALDTKPLPHAFDFQSKAFRFRSEKGSSEYAIAFEVPIANLTATPETYERKQRFHASLLALVKDAQGEIVERVSKDVPSEVSDQYVPALRADCMTYEHAVDLAPGRYTVETAVLDEEGHRASTNVLQLDSREQTGLAMSDLALVHRVEDLERPPDVSDPFEMVGKRATPFVSTTLPAGSEPYVYFVVYPDKNNSETSALRAQFVKSGRVLATKKFDLPQADASGAVQVSIRALAAPGDYEVRVTVDQGHRSVRGSLRYTIAGKG